ncbi:glycosyltransferase family 2 protein [Turicibacter sanguinis]|uniref:glycosyltransferase family 2 protein n=1 Tax=Turicibacter sanguinis TaxID=154288 RepID=UPI0021D4BEF8|nr:glycosyltransferase [Turicibacter sanguinis]MCU7197745.1 glycosyltransferase [Turicibacter sanguinis]
MFFSIIIATLNRKDLVEQCLNSLKKQTFKNYEIIIVDQSDDNETQTYISNYSDIIYKHVNFKGLSKARNWGLKFAKGEYVCLLDDDAEYSEDFLYNSYKYIIENNVVALSGRILDKSSGQNYLKYPDTKKAIKLSEKNMFYLFSSSALVINRNILNNVNGFDELLGVGGRFGSAEETDLLLRIKYINDNIMYFPNLIIYHPVTKIVNKDNKKVYNYASGLGALIKKHIIYFKNYRLIGVLIRLLIRPIIAFLFYYLTFNKVKYMYYVLILRGRLYGLINYKK